MSSDDRLRGEALRAAFEGRTIVSALGWLTSWTDLPQSVIDTVTDDQGVIRLSSSESPFMTNTAVEIIDDLLCGTGPSLGRFCVAVYRNPAGGTVENVDQFIAYEYRMGTFIIRMAT